MVEPMDFFISSDHASNVISYSNTYQEGEPTPSLARHFTSSDLRSKRHARAPRIARAIDLLALAARYA